MSRRNSNPISSLASLAAIAAGVAAGVWLFKNREKIPEWKKEADNFQAKFEAWQKQMQRDWMAKQQDLEKWSEEWKQDPGQQAAKAVSKAKDFVQEKVEDARVYLKEASKKTKVAAKAKAGESFDLSKRQESIYQIVKKSPRASMSDFAKSVDGVTTRTLRRDLTKLEKLGLIEQVGKTKDSFYRVRK